MTPSSPSANKHIAHPYGPDTLVDKVRNKTALQEELGWAAEPKRAVLCIPSGVSDQTGGKLLEELIPGLLELPIQILILGKGSASYGKTLTELAKKHGNRIAIVPNDEKSLSKMYAASDMALFLYDGAHAELSACLTYGTVPVGPAMKDLEDYNPNQESGNGFLYKKNNVWHVFAAVTRALETYKFPYDWKTIQKHGMKAEENENEE